MKGNLKKEVYKDRKNTNETKINHRGTKMVKDGED